MSNITTQAQPTMTSLQIAELVESRHDKVKQSIERLVAREVISLPPMGEVKIRRQRREEVVAAYLFTGDRGKRDSTVVVARLSPEFTARLVDRWQELEKTVALQQFNVPTTLHDALRLAADLEGEREKLALENKAQAEKLAAAAPKVQALDRIAGTDGTLCLRMAAKTLQTNPYKLRDWLIDNGWLYRQTACPKKYAAYQHIINSGWAVHKMFTHYAAGFPQTIVGQVRITAKGLTKLGQVLAA